MFGKQNVKMKSMWECVWLTKDDEGVNYNKNKN